MTLENDHPFVELLDVDGGPEGPDPEFDDDVNVVDDPEAWKEPGGASIE